MLKVCTILRKLLQNKWILRSVFSSIYINFYYLPISQAVRLPIIVYKPHFEKMGGKVIITSSVIKTGMIKLGNNQVSLFPNTGLVWENHGGVIEFKGKCSIGNASAISVGATGYVCFGRNFKATTSFRLTSYCSIIFNDNVLCGWDCLFMDTDFHSLKKAGIENCKVRAFSPIIIGNNNWFGLKCVILKGTETPDFCTVGACSLLCKKYQTGKNSLLAGNPAEFKKNGIYRDYLDDSVNYNES